MVASRPYYTLIVYEKEKNCWAVAFGDYDRETVSQERKDSYCLWETAVFRTSDRQAEIDAALAHYNTQFPYGKTAAALRRSRKERGPL